jgi:hypothetical protein
MKNNFLLDSGALVRKPVVGCWCNNYCHALIYTSVTLTDQINMKVNLAIIAILLTTNISFGQAIKASEAEYFMKASINGESWSASEMIIDKDQSNIVQVHGRNGKTFLQFSLYKPATGKEKSFSLTSPANWADETDLDIYVGEEGKATVTGVTEKFIEGTFSFKGKCKGKTVLVTEGVFRIANPKQFQ